MENKTTSHSKNKNQSHRRGPLHLLRVALFMLRSRSAGKSNSVDVGVTTKGLWKRLVGSMRPLHLQHNQTLPTSIKTTNPTTPIVEPFQDVPPPPMSPQLLHSPSSSSSDDSMSRYASAQNLQQLAQSVGCNLDDDFDDGDEMIDAKAEEFIAHFYEQMRLQRLDSIKCYNDMIERGLR